MDEEEVGERVNDLAAPAGRTDTRPRLDENQFLAVNLGQQAGGDGRVSPGTDDDLRLFFSDEPPGLEKVFDELEGIPSRALDKIDFFFVAQFNGVVSMVGNKEMVEFAIEVLQLHELA